LANQLAECENFKIIIYCWKSNNKVHWGNWNDNIKIRVLPFLKYYQRESSKLFYYFWIKKDNPFCVLLNFLYHGESFLPSNLNYIYILHSPASQVPKRYDYIKNRICKFKNMTFVAVSNFVKDQALKYMPKKNIKVIYNAVDINFFRPKDILKNKNLKLITLSALEKRKRIQNVILAIKQINDPHIFYDIFGEGPYKDEIIKMIKRYKLQNQIKLMGVSNFPEKCLIEYNVFILLSKGEAFPIAPLEAMSCGLPVLVSNEKPYDEFISEKYGILINPNSQKDIMDAILKMKIESTRVKLGSEARNMISKSFSLEIMKQKYLELILSFKSK